MLDFYHSRHLYSKFQRILQVLIANKLAKLSWYGKFDNFMRSSAERSTSFCKPVLKRFSRVPQRSMYVPKTVCQKNTVSPSETRNLSGGFDDISLFIQVYFYKFNLKKPKKRCGDRHHNYSSWHSYTLVIKAQLTLSEIRYLSSFL